MIQERELWGVFFQRMKENTISCAGGWGRGQLQPGAGTRRPWSWEGRWRLWAQKKLVVEECAGSFHGAHILLSNLGWVENEVREEALEVWSEKVWNKGEERMDLGSGEWLPESIRAPLSSVVLLLKWEPYVWFCFCKHVWLCGCKGRVGRVSWARAGALPGSTSRGGRGTRGRECLWGMVDDLDMNTCDSGPRALSRKWALRREVKDVKR